MILQKPIKLSTVIQYAIKYCWMEYGHLICSGGDELIWSKRVKKLERLLVKVERLESEERKLKKRITLILKPK